MGKRLYKVVSNFKIATQWHIKGATLWLTLSEAQQYKDYVRDITPEPYNETPEPKAETPKAKDGAKPKPETPKPLEEAKGA